VTEVFIQNHLILERLMHWYQLIAPLLVSLAVNFDIFLDLEEPCNNGAGSCSYYLVNYAAQSIFWLRDISTSALGLPEIRGADHLGMLKPH
jgi:hypothetical protein